MKRAGPPLFLARQSYRRRRVADAARLLPVLGGALFLLPLVWRSGGGPPLTTARGTVYLFAVWCVLIGAAFLVSRVLGRAPEAPAPPADGDAGRSAAQPPGEPD